MEKWLKFYRPFFNDDQSVESFVEACERLAPPNNAAKIMMHQCQRLVSISDDLPRIRPHDEPLRLLFLIMCAENVAKLHDAFLEEGKSRVYVRKFFENFLNDSDKTTLSSSFLDHSQEPMRPLELRKVVNMLYAVRCDVVHEGNYASFAFHDGRIPMVNTDPDVTSQITFDQFRTIVVNGCINASKARLPEA